MLHTYRNTLPWHEEGHKSPWEGRQVGVVFYSVLPWLNLGAMLCLTPRRM